MKKLLQLLRGTTDHAQREFENYCETIQEEKLLWYPSAGKDFRDLLETTGERSSVHNITSSPTVFCHTDFNFNLRVGEQVPIENENMQVSTESLCPLEFDPEQVNFSFQQKPQVFLAKVRFLSDEMKQNQSHQHVLIFKMQNFDFLDGIVLRHRIQVSHFVKVREGIGFGGAHGAHSIAIFYALLGDCRTEYLLVDEEIQFPRQLTERLKAVFNLPQSNYSLGLLHEIHSWSGFTVKCFQVQQQPAPFGKEVLEQHLGTISEKWIYASEDYASPINQLPAIAPAIIPLTDDEFGALFPNVPPPQMPTKPSHRYSVRYSLNDNTAHAFCWHEEVLVSVPVAAYKLVNGSWEEILHGF